MRDGGLWIQVDAAVSMAAGIGRTMLRLEQRAGRMPLPELREAIRRTARRLVELRRAIKRAKRERLVWLAADVINPRRWPFLVTDPAWICATSRKLARLQGRLLDIRMSLVNTPSARHASVLGSEMAPGAGSRQRRL